jgi:hypothetical protein
MEIFMEEACSMTYIPEESKVFYRSKDGKKENCFIPQEWLVAMCSYVPNKVDGTHAFPLPLTHKAESPILPPQKRTSYHKKYHLYRPGYGISTGVSLHPDH